MVQTVLRLPDVLKATGLSQSTIYAKVAADPPTFPKPIPLTGRAVGWLESEISAWQESRMAQRDGAEKAAA
jgi:prophage regulatory protein